VLGEEVVNGDQYSLVQGRARESPGDPKAMIGWIGYRRGFVIEATMQYPVRTIEPAPQYASINSARRLTYQDVYTPSLESTLEISHSRSRLAPVPAFRVPSERYRS